MRAVLFYDAGCGLCHLSVRVLLALDRAGALCFAPLGGGTFRGLVPEAERAALPDSLVLRTADGRLLVRSAAVLESLCLVGGPAKWLAVAARVVPRPLADRLYDGVRAACAGASSRPPAGACPAGPGRPPRALPCPDRRLRRRASFRFTTTIVASSSQGRPSPQARAASKSRSRMAWAGWACLSRTIARTRSRPKNSSGLVAALEDAVGQHQQHLARVHAREAAPEARLGQRADHGPTDAELHLGRLPGLRLPEEEDGRLVARVHVDEVPVPLELAVEDAHEAAREPRAVDHAVELLEDVGDLQLLLDPHAQSRSPRRARGAPRAGRGRSRRRSRGRACPR